MRDFYPERADAAGMKANQRVLARHVDAEHYRRWVGANDFHLVTPVTRTVVIVVTPVVNFPDAATGDAHAIIERPAFWSAGRVGLRLYYTTDTTSAGNFTVRPVVYARAVGSDIGVNTPGEFAVQAADVPAGAAGVISSWEMTVRAPVDAGDSLIVLRVRRDGTNAGDTAAAVMRLLGALLTYHPNRTEVV